jgi:hypothetical protein
MNRLSPKITGRSLLIALRIMITAKVFLIFKNSYHEKDNYVNHMFVVHFR